MFEEGNVTSLAPAAKVYHAHSLTHSDPLEPACPEETLIDDFSMQYLNNELILKVFSYLDKENLKQTALVNQHWRGLTRRAVYQALRNPVTSQAKLLFYLPSIITGQPISNYFSQFGIENVSFSCPLTLFEFYEQARTVFLRGLGIFDYTRMDWPQLIQITKEELIEKIQSIWDRLQKWNNDSFEKTQQSIEQLSNPYEFLNNISPPISDYEKTQWFSDYRQIESLVTSMIIFGCIRAYLHLYQLKNIAQSRVFVEWFIDTRWHHLLPSSAIVSMTGYFYSPSLIHELILRSDQLNQQIKSLSENPSQSNELSAIKEQLKGVNAVLLKLTVKDLIHFLNQTCIKPLPCQTIIYAFQIKHPFVMANPSYPNQKLTGDVLIQLLQGINFVSNNQGPLAEFILTNSELLSLLKTHQQIADIAKYLSGEAFATVLQNKTFQQRFSNDQNKGALLLAIVDAKGYLGWEIPKHIAIVNSLTTESIYELASKSVVAAQLFIKNRSIINKLNSEQLYQVSRFHENPEDVLPIALYHLDQFNPEYLRKFIQEYGDYDVISEAITNWSKNKEKRAKNREALCLEESYLYRNRALRKKTRAAYAIQALDLSSRATNKYIFQKVKELENETILIEEKSEASDVEVSRSENVEEVTETNLRTSDQQSSKTPIIQNPPTVIPLEKKTSTAQIIEITNPDILKQPHTIQPTVQPIEIPKVNIGDTSGQWLKTRMAITFVLLLLGIALCVSGWGTLLGLGILSSLTIGVLSLKVLTFSSIVVGSLLLLISPIVAFPKFFKRLCCCEPENSLEVEPPTITTKDYLDHRPDFGKVMHGASSVLNSSSDLPQLSSFPQNDDQVNLSLT